MDVSVPSPLFFVVHVYLKPSNLIIILVQSENTFAPSLFKVRNFCRNYKEHIYSLKKSGQLEALLLLKMSSTLLNGLSLTYIDMYLKVKVKKMEVLLNKQKIDHYLESGGVVI